MKRDDIILGIILLVMVVCSGILAKNLNKKQQEIASSRQLVTKTPLAGFHKFAADVAWMKFLQMDSTHNVNEKNAKIVYDEIIKIIELDPDFFLIYEVGAMMLQAVEPELALNILERAREHPKHRHVAKIHVLAHHIILQPELNNFYKKKEISKKQVRRALLCLQEAIQAPDCTARVYNSLVITQALTQYNHLESQDFSMLELSGWFEKWQESSAASEAYLEESSWSGIDLDMAESKMLMLMKFITKTIINNKQIDDIKRWDARVLVNAVRTAVFPDRIFDQATRIPHSGQAFEQTNNLESIKKKRYTVLLDARSSYALDNLSLRLINSTGPAEVVIKINGKPVSFEMAYPVMAKTENLNAIAGKFSVPLDQLADINLLKVKDKKTGKLTTGSPVVKKGKILRIPVASRMSLKPGKIYRLKAGSWNNKLLPGSTLEIEVLNSNGGDLSYNMQLFQGFYR